MVLFWGSNVWNHNAPPWWSSLLLLGLLALGPLDTLIQRSFGIWILILFGIAHTGVTTGALILPLLIIHQLNPRSNKTILLEMCLTCSLCGDHISIDNACSINLVVGRSNLEWYTDLETNTDN